MEERSSSRCDCLCRECLRWWQGNCPHGTCFDDFRAKEKPYTAVHRDTQRPQWSDQNKPGEREHWCRGGVFYPTSECEYFGVYAKPTTLTCFGANVTKWKDGSLLCPLAETIGCVQCIAAWQQSQKFE